MAWQLEIRFHENIKAEPLYQLLFGAGIKHQDQASYRRKGLWFLTVSMVAWRVAEVGGLLFTFLSTQEAVGTDRRGRQGYKPQSLVTPPASRDVPPRARLHLLTFPNSAAPTTS